MLKLNYTPVIFLLLLGSAYAGTAFDKTTAYYFDWLKPETTRCKKVDEKLLSQAQTCHYKADTSFGGKPAPSYVCSIGKRSEVMLFASKAVCQEQLETMRANAP